MHNRGYKEFGEGYLTEIFTDANIDFLKGHREDPFESQDLMGQHPAEVERLQELYAVWSEEVDEALGSEAGK